MLKSPGTLLVKGLGLLALIVATASMQTVEASPPTTAAPTTAAPTTAAPTTKAPTNAPTRAPTTPTAVPTASPTYICPNSDYTTNVVGGVGIAMTGTSIISTAVWWIWSATQPKPIHSAPGRKEVFYGGLIHKSFEFTMFYFWITVWKALIGVFVLLPLVLYYFVQSCGMIHYPRVLSEYSTSGQITTWYIILLILMLIVDAAFMGTHPGAFVEWISGRTARYGMRRTLKGSNSASGYPFRSGRSTRASNGDLVEEGNPRFNNLNGEEPIPQDPLDLLNPLTLRQG